MLRAGVRGILRVVEALIDRNARALASLHPAVEALLATRDARVGLEEVVARGHFRPAAEERLMAWFGRFLSIRTGLWEVIEEVGAPIDGDPGRIETDGHRRCFVLGYAAACLVVGLDRHLVEDFATDALLQRKLNEGDAARRIPRKQFTAAFKSLGSPSNAWSMYEAMRFADRNRPALSALADDARVGSLVAALPALEAHLDASKRGYWKRLVGYRDHSLRRRLASGTQRTTFAFLASSGRMVAELRDQHTPKRVSPAIRAELAKQLRPGDVIVTRHDRALSNLFLPGYWPHVALYVGSNQDREALGIEVDDQRAALWQGEIRTLEALKDGVRLRPLSETLAVDAVAILRPRLAEHHIAEAIGRALQHEGKRYNFDFDFFRADRLVCSEVIYRAYDGVAGIELPLQERAGRPTLSAEDLLDLAVEERWFHCLALYGATTCPENLVTSPDARNKLATSYR